jgi:hypothetical protein
LSIPEFLRSGYRDYPLITQLCKPFPTPKTASRNDAIGKEFQPRMERKRTELTELTEFLDAEGIRVEHRQERNGTMEAQRYGEAILDG